MAINLLILLFLSFVFFYKEIQKKILSWDMVLVLIISLTIKIMFILFESTGMFLNQFTIRDEVTFLRSERVENMNPGDNFFISFLYFFRSIYDDETFIKFLPIFFSILYFYYLVRIMHNLKYEHIYRIIILFISLVSPAYLMFNYSITKEFLQGVFLIPCIYYSLRVIDKINYIKIFKLLFFLVLFSFTHRGFEVISIFILLLSLLFSLFNMYSEFFKKNILLLLVFLVSLSVVLFFVVINSPVGSNFASEDFAIWFNNIRESHMTSKNTYRITVESNEIYDIISTISLTVYYYFFYIVSLDSLKHAYFFLDSLVCALLIMTVVYSVFFNYNYNNINPYKYIFLVAVFLAMSIGFAIFTYNIGNAMRHKSVTNVLLYLFFPLMFNLIISFSQRPKKIFYQYNNQSTN